MCSLIEPELLGGDNMQVNVRVQAHQPLDNRTLPKQLPAGAAGFPENNYSRRCLLGQLQFELAESGASGQTAVTEDDVRRFRFPRVHTEKLIELVRKLDETRQNIAAERQSLANREREAWEAFYGGMLE